MIINDSGGFCVYDFYHIFYDFIMVSCFFRFSFMSPNMQTVAGTCKGGRRVRGVILKANSVQELHLQAWGLLQHLESSFQSKAQLHGWPYREEMVGWLLGGLLRDKCLAVSRPEGPDGAESKS